MKVTSKHWSILLAGVAGCTSRPPSQNASVDVWTSSSRPAHVHLSTRHPVCVQSGANAKGWEIRLDGSETDTLRRVDIEIPRVERDGTSAFYAGVTTLRDGRLEQWTIETRPGAARRYGEGTAWTEMSSMGVTTAVVARIDSSWYSIRVQCGSAF